MNIHYNPTTGEIVAWDNVQTGLVPQAIPGCAVLAMQGHPSSIDTTRQKVSAGSIVDKTPSELLFTLLPSEFEVRGARAIELSTTDYTDSARHLSDEERANWITYRQTLRDLGALTNPVEMIEAWPKRPDGNDAIPHLRERI